MAGELLERIDEYRARNCEVRREIANGRQEELLRRMTKAAERMFANDCATTGSMGPTIKMTPGADTGETGMDILWRVDEATDRFNDELAAAALKAEWREFERQPNDTVEANDWYNEDADDWYIEEVDSPYLRPYSDEDDDWICSNEFGWDRPPRRKRPSYQSFSTKWFHTNARNRRFRQLAKSWNCSIGEATLRFMGYRIHKENGDTNFTKTGRPKRSQALYRGRYPKE